jgi:hypothetical protein
VLWKRENADLAERCAKCGRPVIGLKRHRLQATPVFHPECLPPRKKGSQTAAV